MPARKKSEPLYLNRELSLLKFNERVLAMAEQPDTPLLEKLRYVCIVSSNLDEFFEIRISSLKAQQAQFPNLRGPDGLTAAEALEKVQVEVHEMVDKQYSLLNDHIYPQLKTEGVVLHHASEWNDAQRSWAHDVFIRDVMPLLTPIGLDPAHPFPFIPNLGLSLLFDLRHKVSGEAVRELIMIPAGLARFVEPEPGRFVPVEAVLRHFAGRIFPTFEVLGSAAFRLIRDSDIEIEEEAEDLVRSFRSAILRRRRGRVIHIVTERIIPRTLRQLIAGQLDEGASLTESDVLLGLADLDQVVGVDHPELKFHPYTPRFPERIREHDGDCFAAIRQKDIVVHHPYEAFDVVLAFLRQKLGL